MKSLLIITTKKDSSVSLFLSKKNLSKIKIDFVFFDLPFLDFIKKLENMEYYDFIYVRDPFNAPFLKRDINKKLHEIFSHRGLKNYFVDNLKSIEDIYFEDKWIQYQTFFSFMPKTFLFENIFQLENLNVSHFLAKKRIASRGKGTLFDIKKLKIKDVGRYIL
jgi:hypothetical protein